MEEILPIEMIRSIINTLNSSKDLCNCRLVNRRWNILSSERLKSVHEIIPYKEETLSSFIDCFHLTFQDFPFTKFHFQLDQFTTPKHIYLFTEAYHLNVKEVSFELRTSRMAWGDLHKIQSILKLIQAAPYLTTLQVNITGHLQIVNEEEFYRLLWLSPSSLLNLRSIQFNRDITVTKAEDDWRFVFLQLIKNAAPNLERVIISAWKGTQLSRITSILEKYKETRRISLRNVTFLTYDPLDLQILKHMTQCCLTELHLRLKYDYDKASDDDAFNYDQVRHGFTSWLQGLSKTLKTLTLILEEVSEFQLPKLDALENLVIGLGTYNDVDVGNPLLPFDSEQFPKLKSVTLNFYSEDWNLFSGPFITIDSLRIQGYQEEFIHDNWHLIFPNLNSLELACLKPIQLEYLLNHMSNIQHLRLELYDVGSGSTRVYTLRPLAAFTRLESLYLTGCGQTTLQELVDMSQDGSLKPLVTLTITNELPMAQLEVLRAIHGYVWTVRGSA